MPSRPIAASVIRAIVGVCLALSVATASFANVVVKVSGPEAVGDAVRGASLLAAVKGKKMPDAQTLFASARADYARILGALYAEGYYSGVISIRIDGREAADIAPLDAPKQIGKIVVTVDPGPQFTFAHARMRPYAKGTELPSSYTDRAIARSTAITDAAEAGVMGWRNRGHAKARVSEQDIVANHRSNTVDSLLLLDPGPRLRFGKLELTGNERLTTKRLEKIAGFPTGKVYSPERLQTVSDRLRRTGIFKSVALTEADRPNPDGTLDYTLLVEEDALHRYGFGAEIQSTDGLSLSGYWLHRNLFGGGERLRFDAAVTGIGSTNGTDYSLGVRLDRPATPDPDTTAFVEALTERQHDVNNYIVSDASVTLGFNRVFSNDLSASVGISYGGSRVDDNPGIRYYRQLSFPVSAIWDTRDDIGNPSRGFYVSGEGRPFVGFGTTGSGIRLFGDARTYWSPSREKKLILAGRVQVGSVLGPTLLDTPRDYLFYSGGGGTVRGQPYQSLGVPLSTGVLIGGQSFFGFSGEARVAINEKIGVVGFYDAGYIAPTNFGSGGEWQSGAGVGLRYFTTIGPIRFDVAAPVTGTTGKGVQFYLGIGQAF